MQYMASDKDLFLSSMPELYDLKNITPKNIKDSSTQQQTETIICSYLNKFVEDSLAPSDQDLLSYPVINGDKMMTPPPSQPQFDHNYTPEYDDQTIVLNNISLSDANCQDGSYSSSPCPSEYGSFYASSVCEETMMGNQLDVLDMQNINCSGIDSFAAMNLESDKSTICSDVSYIRTKRGRPRQSENIYLQRINPAVPKEKAKVWRNNASSIKYRHKKADEKINLIQYVAKLKNRHEKLLQKNQKLERDIKLLGLLFN